MTHSFIPRHAPQGTWLLAFVQAYFDAWLIYRRRTGRFIPWYVIDEFLDFLACGDPEQGFTVLACPESHYSRYVSGRCKGRGFCPYCLSIRQRELGEHLIEHVIGNVPIRHVVLCFPPPLRYVLCYDERLLDGGFATLSAAVFQHQRDTAAALFKIPRHRIHPGGIVTHHRASATLQPNHHFHGLFPDGVFIQSDSGDLNFHRLPPPSEADITAIAHDACLRFCKTLSELGFWKTIATTGDTIEGVLTLPKSRPEHTKFFGQAAKDSEGGTAPRNGAYAFHVFVGNALELEERAQLEYLVRYVLAPPLKDNQFSQDEGGNAVIELKRERHDGTARIVIEPFEVMDRLADLVPRPNTNSVRYFGIYAPRAKLRKLAISLQVGNQRPAPRPTGGSLVCPICAKKLRVISEVRARRSRTAATPPDTPAAITPRGQDRIGYPTTNGEQGRLFG